MASMESEVAGTLSWGGATPGPEILPSDPERGFHKSENENREHQGTLPKRYGILVKTKVTESIIFQGHSTTA